MLRRCNYILFVGSVTIALVASACVAPSGQIESQTLPETSSGTLNEENAKSNADFSLNESETVESLCDLSAISAGPLSIEGASDSDPNRVYLNEQFRFEPGPTIEVRGKKRTSVKILETMEMGFYRNWLSDGVTALASQIAGGLSSSCSNVVGTPSSGLIGYLPPTGRFQIGVTKRACAVIDIPCGLPEEVCEGGRVCCPPEFPVCTTRVPMCRTEQSTDIFSASAIVEFQLNLALTGDVPSQRLTLSRVMTKNEVSTSTGDLFKLFHDIGLADILGLRMGDLENAMRNTINEGAKALQSGGAAFKIPTADFVYLPKATEVSWSSPTNKPPGAAPFSIVVKREMALPTTLACKVISCIKQSKNAGKLLFNSCNI